VNHFAAALTAVGLLLILSATRSGLVQRTMLSLPMLSVAAGAALEVSGVLTVTPGAEPIVLVVEVVLLVTLFSDGLLVEQEVLRRHWRAPVRALVIAMPLTRSCWRSPVRRCSAASGGTRRCCWASSCRRRIP